MTGSDLLQTVRAAQGEIDLLEDRLYTLKQAVKQLEAVPEDYQLRIAKLGQELQNRKANAEAERAAAVIMLDDLFLHETRKREVCAAFYLDGETVSGCGYRLHISPARVKAVKHDAVRILSAQDARPWLP